MQGEGQWRLPLIRKVRWRCSSTGRVDHASCILLVCWGNGESCATGTGTWKRYCRCIPCIFSLFFLEMCSLYSNMGWGHFSKILLYFTSAKNGGQLLQKLPPVESWFFNSVHWFIGAGCKLEICHQVSVLIEALTLVLITWQNAEQKEELLEVAYQLTKGTWPLRSWHGWIELLSQGPLKKSQGIKELVVSFHLVFPFCDVVRMSDFLLTDPFCSRLSSADTRPHTVFRP